MSKFKLSYFWLAIMFISFSCKNDLDGVVKGSYDCYGNITNVQFALSSLNDCPFPTGLPGSTYRIVAEFDHGECLDSNTVIIDRVYWYDESDDEVGSSVDVSYKAGSFYPVGNKIITNLCLRFGTSAKYAEVYMFTSNMLQVQDPLTDRVIASKIRIDKPEGAN